MSIFWSQHGFPRPVTKSCWGSPSVHTWIPCVPAYPTLLACIQEVNSREPSGAVYQYWFTRLLMHVCGGRNETPARIATMRAALTWQAEIPFIGQVKVPVSYLCAGFTTWSKKAIQRRWKRKVNVRMLCGNANFSAVITNSTNSNSHLLEHAMACLRLTLL